jgi:hypothetical protein
MGHYRWHDATAAATSVIYFSSSGDHGGRVSDQRAKACSRQSLFTEHHSRTETERGACFRTIS